jgi:hypothetical protein
MDKVYHGGTLTFHLDPVTGSAIPHSVRTSSHLRILDSMTTATRKHNRDPESH